MEIYPLDSAIHLLNNRGLVDSTIQLLNNPGQMVSDSVGKSILGILNHHLRLGVRLVIRSVELCNLVKTAF